MWHKTLSGGALALAVDTCILCGVVSRTSAVTSRGIVNMAALAVVDAQVRGK